jgi:predicted ester cyclase
MADSDPKALVLASFETANGHDIDALMSFFSDAILIRGPGGQKTEGKDAVRAQFEAHMTAYPDFHTEVLRQFVDGEHVITECRESSVHTGDATLATGETIAPTGKKVVLDVLYVDRVVDGKIVESTAYFDRHAFLQQIGQIQ